MNHTPEDKPALPLEELSITPEWVKAPVKSYEHHHGEDRSERGREGDGRNRDRRPPRRDRKEGGSGFRRDGRPPERAKAPGQPPTAQRESGPPRHDNRRPHPRNDRPQQPIHPPVAPVEVSFFPEDTGFASMIEAMKNSPRAYALFDLTRLILNKPERHLVRLTRQPAPDGTRAPLFLVVPSESPFLTQEDAVRSLFRQHRDLLFKENKKPVDAPKGNFAFVNRCGMTGELLGPPNYHEYQKRLVRHHQQRLAQVPFEQFKARIQTVRDPEAVKAWVDSMSFKTEYEYIGGGEPKAFSTLAELEKHFRENDLAKFITSAPELRISGLASRKISHVGILDAVRQAWESERKFPLRTANDLRSRLRKEGFHFFKHNKEITYISTIKLKRFESLSGLTEQVQKLVAFLRSNEGINRKQLVEKLLPSSGSPPSSEPTAGSPDAAATTPPVPSTPSPDGAGLLADLRWLVMEGYVVEFSDGRLWALEDRPPQPPPASKAAPSNAAAQAAPAPAQPTTGKAKIGVIHYNFPGFSFPEFLKFAAETGFGYVELQIPDVWSPEVENPEQNAERIRKELESFGLKVSALAAHNDFVQLEEGAIQSQVERMKRICGLAKILNDEAVIRAEGGAPKESVPQEMWIDAMFACFTRCIEFVEAMKIGLAIDNHGLVTNDGDLLHALLQKLDCKRIGANLDTMNFRWFGHDVATCNRFYEMLAPRALHTHFKDGFGSREQYRGAALGEGEIDLKHALDCLRKAGYQGVYCAEYEGPELQGGVGYRKCCEWLKRME